MRKTHILAIAIIAGLTLPALGQDFFKPLQDAIEQLTPAAGTADDAAGAGARGDAASAARAAGAGGFGGAGGDGGYGAGSGGRGAG